ncbi:DUF1871 family protein [Bacillus sp. DJP31]|uniref:DUF1871 family protein n=1 Tax=Bacillus sp. DJP31 TaxID=3409789 RepID=UPI003BB718E5
MNEVNSKIYDTLYYWDPFQIGPGNYDPEISDIIAVLHECDDISIIVKKIKGIFEFSFENSPTDEECIRMTMILLNLKNEESCSL